MNRPFYGNAALLGLTFMCVMGWPIISLDCAEAARELTDAELDEVAAGTNAVEVLNGVMNFQFHNALGQGRAMNGSGAIALSQSPLIGSIGSLVVRDSAQGNLRSFVNVNAVNSAVQILINLNVNIQSQIGEIRQLNLSGLQ